MAAPSALAHHIFGSTPHENRPGWFLSRTLQRVSREALQAHPEYVPSAISPQTSAFAITVPSGLYITVSGAALSHPHLLHYRLPERLALSHVVTACELFGSLIRCEPLPLCHPPSCDQSARRASLPCSNVMPVTHHTRRYQALWPLPSPCLQPQTPAPRDKHSRRPCMFKRRTSRCGQLCCDDRTPHGGCSPVQPSMPRSAAMRIESCALLLSDSPIQAADLCTPARSRVRPVVYSVPSLLRRSTSANHTRLDSLL